MCLHAERLAKFHDRPAQAAQLVSHSLGVASMKFFSSNLSVFLVQERSLKLICEVAASEPSAQLHQSRSTGKGFSRAHQSQAPFFKACVAIFRDRSTRASVFSFPFETSCSQCKTMPM